jgi:hypothetical protein
MYNTDYGYRTNVFFRGIMVTDYITDSVPVIEEPFGLNVKIADPERLLMTYLPTMITKDGHANYFSSP